MVIWLRRNADRMTLVAGAALVVAGVQQILGNEAAMVAAGVLLMAGSVRRRRS